MKKRNKILIVDDNKDILEDFTEILMSSRKETKIDKEILELENILFKNSNQPGKTEPVKLQPPDYLIHTAQQGEKAIELVKKSEAESYSYDLIFMDIKMPPGMDGVETIKEIWKINPDIEVVICTAFTDYSWEEIISTLGITEHLLFLKKPINPIEIKQTALSLINKREADKEKRHLRNYLKNIIDSMPSLIISINDEAKIIHFNQEAEKYTGYAFDQAVGEKVLTVIPDLTGEMDVINEVLKDLMPRKKEKVKWIKEDQVFYKDITIYPLIDQNSHGAVIRVDEITNRVRMEEMMIQTEKMLSVGGLAAGMAHEINNPLANILQSIQLIQTRLSKDLPVNKAKAEESGTTIESIQNYMSSRDIHSMLNIIKESGQRSAEIVKDMLSFSRKGSSQLDETDICTLLDKTVEIASSDYMLKEKFDFKQIKIIKEYSKDLAPIRCEKNNIQLVFLNILKNGAHAMAEKDYGEVTPCFKLRVWNEAPYIHVEIEDNGPGIPEQVKKRIFEPFFTTKPVGTGTGLGLSVSYFIITKNHHGSLDIISEVNKGAKFVIKLPFNPEEYRDE